MQLNMRNSDAPDTDPLPTEPTSTTMPAPAAKPRPGSVRARAKTARGLRIPSLRTREGRQLLEFRDALIKHVGNKPSSVQLALIDRAVTLQMHLNRMDEIAATNGAALSEHSTRVYLAWSNTLARTLKLLGLKGEKERPPSIAELMAQSRPAA